MTLPGLSATDTNTDKPGRRDAKRKRTRCARPEFNQLDLFLLVAETLSFSAAARRSGRTQPTVSRAIGRLEELCGADLFERRMNAPLVLTPVGEAIIPTVRLLLHTVDNILISVVRAATSEEGALRLGFYPGLASGPLRNAVADFAATYPGARLQLVEDMPGALYRQLTERAIDLMIVALMPDLASTEFAQERLWEERLVVALQEDHPLAAKTTLTWRDVAALRLIMRAATGEYTGYHAFLRHIGGRTVECKHHAVSRGALLDMVALGLGATITFETAIAAHAGVAFRPIEDNGAAVTVQAIWPAADSNPLRHNFLKCLRAAVAPCVPSAPEMP